LNKLLKMPLSVRSTAWKPVPQNNPAPRHIRIVAHRDTYGVRPRQSLHAADTPQLATHTYTHNMLTSTYTL